MTRKLNVIDLFCGSGGLSYGFMHNEAFNLIAAVDILPDMTKTYELNHPGVKVLTMDIGKFDCELYKKESEQNPKEVDIVVGGPPCQAYSTVGKRLLDDPRGKLFQEYYRILKEFQPKFFIYENVKGLLSMQRGNLINTITELFESLGYFVQVKLLNAANYGVPQIRERVIITGSHFDNNFLYPEPTHGNGSIDLFNTVPLKKFVTMKDALSDLPCIGNGEAADYYAKPPQNEYQKVMRSNSSDLLTEHHYPKNGPRLIEIMESLPEGGMLMDIPESIRPQKAFYNSYSRLWWEKPSTTITRNFGTPSSARCVHPLVPRALTTREGARLQSYPDDYVFVGNKVSKNLQIGNSVPPMLSVALADCVYSYFKSKD